MPKTLTPEQTARAAGIHSRAVDILTASGFTPLRQFQAKGAADSESFELWTDQDGKTVLLHFYAEAAGVELYAQQPGNSWDAMRAALVTLSQSGT